jgi:peptide/nickel transport system permease protein
MTDIAAAPRRDAALTALFRHARYVIAENPVTGFAFALFVLIVLAAILGPNIVPYNPLSSDTAQALKPPSAHHWFGTDQLGRDVFSRVIVATRLDFFIAVASVALVFLMGGLAGVAAGPTASSAASPTPSWRSRCSCSPWASSRRWAIRCRTSYWPPRS